MDIIELKYYRAWIFCPLIIPIVIHQEHMPKGLEWPRIIAPGKVAGPLLT